MKKLKECGEERVLWRAFTKKDRQVVKRILEKYNEWGYLAGGYMPGRKDFVYTIYGEPVWVGIFHILNVMHLAVKYRLSPTNTYVVRRMASVEEAKKRYGPFTVEALRCAVSYLCEHGAEAVLALVMPEIEGDRRSGATYKRAGFEKLGVSNRRRAVWFIYRCRGGKKERGERDGDDG